MSDIRKALRDATLGKKSVFAEKKVEIEGNTFVIRQPNLKQRQALLKKCKTDDGGIDFVDFLLWSVILCTHTEEGELVFEEQDYDVLINQPAGGFVEQLGNAVAEMTNISDGDEVKK